MAIFPNIKVSGISFEPPETIKNTLSFSDGNRQELYFLPGLYNARLNLILDFINADEVSELLRFWDSVGGLSGTFTIPDSIFKQPDIIKSFINYPNLYWKFDSPITIDTIVATSLKGLWKTQIRLTSVVSNITIENLTIYSPIPVLNMNNVFFCETISVQDYQAPVTITNLNVLYSEHVINFTTGSIFRFENNVWSTYTPDNGTIYIHRSNETMYQYIDGITKEYDRSNVTNQMIISNATQATGNNTGALQVAGGVSALGSIFSKNIDVSGYTDFYVGGVSTTFYPVQLQLIQPSGLSGYGGCQIYRSSYNTPVNTGTFNLEFNFSPTNYGNQASKIDILNYTYFSNGVYSNAVADIVDGTTASANNDVIVWLRGNLSYSLKSLNPGQYWKVINSNVSGTNITDSSGIVRTPTTTQSDLILNANWRSLTLVNGWTNFGSTYQNARAIRKPNGDVEIQGRISINSIPTTGSLITNLPVGMRPSSDLLFSGFITSNSGYGMFEYIIRPNGGIIYSGTSFTVNTYIYATINCTFSVK